METRFISRVYFSRDNQPTIEIYIVFFGERTEKQYSVWMSEGNTEILHSRYDTEEEATRAYNSLCKNIIQLSFTE